MKHSIYLLILPLLCIFSCKDLEEKLQPPLAKEATDIHSEGFTANWESHYGAQNYLLYIAKDAEFKDYLAGYEGKEVNGTSHEVNGLTPEQTYYYKVVSKFKGHLSKSSNTIEVNTGKFYLKAPVALKCVSIAHDRFKVSWQEVHGAEKYVLEVAYDENFEHYVKGYASKVLTEPYREVGELKELTNYYCRVRAVKGKTWSRYSDKTICTTKIRKFRLKQVIYREFVRNPEGEFVPAGDILVTLIRNEKKQVIKSTLAPAINPGNTYREIFFRYDEFGRLIEFENTTETRSFTYDNKDRLVRIENDSPVNDRDFEAEVTYPDKKTFIVNHLNSPVRFTYHLDDFGNIIRIVKELEGNTLVDTYTYVDSKYPKDLNFAAKSLFNTTMFVSIGFPEEELPIWHKPACNVKTARLNNGGLTNELSYEFNECNFPLTREGAVAERKSLSVMVETEFIYEGIPYCTEEIANAE